MVKKLDVLHLEDNRLDSELVRNLLSRLGLLSSYLLVDEEEGFVSAFKGTQPDIVISDINVPDFSGFDALEWMGKNHPLIPIVIVTGSIDEETAAKTIQLGAWDYVVKERLHRLPPAIDNVMKLKAERVEAARARKMADNILRTTPSAVYTVSTEGIITSWNKMAEKITGYAADVIIGQSCRILGSSSCSDLCTLFNKDQIPQALLNKECDLIDAFGVRKYILKNADLLIDEKGEVIGGIESFVDQSDKIQMTKDLIHALEKAEESDRLKSAFLANISHEIRTPLNAIIGFTDLVIDPETPVEERKEFASIIKTGTDQLLSILGNVLQLSLIESGTISLDAQDFDLRMLANELLLIFGGDHLSSGVALELEHADPLIMHSDRNRIAFVLTNLLENAEKFTASGKVSFGYRAYGDLVLLYVSDTGRGIPESIGDRIFERFFRVNDPAHVTRGSGLGLPITKAIVEAMGGSIWFDDNEPRGTTFFVEIPKNITSAE